MPENAKVVVKMIKNLDSTARKEKILLFNEP